MYLLSTTRLPQGLAADHRATLRAGDLHGARPGLGARRRARSRRLVQPVDVGDMHDLPYADASFSGIVCGWTLSYSTRRDVAAKEMERIRRPAATWSCRCRRSRRTSTRRSCPASCTGASASRPGAARPPLPGSGAGRGVRAPAPAGRGREHRRCLPQGGRPVMTTRSRQRRMAEALLPDPVLQKVLRLGARRQLQRWESQLDTAPSRRSRRRRPAVLGHLRAASGRG